MYREVISLPFVREGYSRAYGNRVCGVKVVIDGDRRRAGEVSSALSSAQLTGLQLTTMDNTDKTEQDWNCDNNYDADNESNSDLDETGLLLDKDLDKTRLSSDIQILSDINNDNTQNDDLDETRLSSDLQILSDSNNDNIQNDIHSNDKTQLSFSSDSTLPLSLPPKPKRKCYSYKLHLQKHTSTDALTDIQSTTESIDSLS